MTHKSSIYLQYIVFNNKQIIYKGRVKCHSFVGNIIRFLAAFMLSSRSVSATVLNKNNAIRNINNTIPSTLGITTLGALGTAGDITRGIVVGTGTTETDLTMINLVSPIDTSTLQYQAGSISQLVETANSISFSVSRAITNPSSINTVTIREVGLSIDNCLVIRDLVTIELPPLTSTQITYTFTYSL